MYTHRARGKFGGLGHGKRVPWLTFGFIFWESSRMDRHITEAMMDGQDWVPVGGPSWHPTAW